MGGARDVTTTSGCRTTSAPSACCARLPLHCGGGDTTAGCVVGSSAATAPRMSSQVCLSAPAAAAAAAAAPAAAAAAAAAPTAASAPASAPASACLTVSLHAISGLALGNDRPDPVRVCDGCFKAKNPEQLPQATVPVPITGGQAAEQEQPEPEAEGGREGQGGLLAPQRIAVPSGPVFGVSAGQHTEEAEEGEEEENSGGLEAVEVPLPLAATEAHAGARQESMRRLTEAVQSRCVWGGVGGWGVGGAVSPLRVISS